MKLFIINYLLFSIIIGGLVLFVSVGSVNAQMSPRAGTVLTPTGTPIQGAKVTEFTDWCPPHFPQRHTLGDTPHYANCTVPQNCYVERTTRTDASGKYFFEPWTPPIPAATSSNPCDLNVWWMYTCWNPKISIKAQYDGAVQASGIVPAANAAEQICVSNTTTREVPNQTAEVITDITCTPVPACNVMCAKDGDCAGAKDGCTVCNGGVCKPPSACNTTCERDDQCKGSIDGCTVCLPSDNGEGKVCRPPAACNVACTRDDQCAGAKDGCTSCIAGVCKKPPACNESCTNSAECAKSGSSCTECLPGDSGAGTVCRPPAACNVACTRDDQCAGAKDGCTVCLKGACKPPPSCGTACTDRSDCANPKDGCSECLEGTCTDYNDNMCKCDGIVADLQYPSNAFKFEAFGKVEGTNTKKAEIADITFRMTKDNQVIAKSNPITPQIVENSAQKVRFKAIWQTTPPQVDKNATYRVFADVRCKPKRIVAEGNQSFTPNEKLTAKGENTQLQPLSTPKGLQVLADGINMVGRFFGRGSDLITKEALAQQFSQTSPANTQADPNLQLRTLNFIKLLDTDNCRFVMWKFDETLF